MREESQAGPEPFSSETNLSMWPSLCGSHSQRLAAGQQRCGHGNEAPDGPAHSGRNHRGRRSESSWFLSGRSSSFLAAPVRRGGRGGEHGEVRDGAGNPPRLHVQPGKECAKDQPKQGGPRTPSSPMQVHITTATTTSAVLYWPTIVVDLAWLLPSLGVLTPVSCVSIFRSESEFANLQFSADFDAEATASCRHVLKPARLAVEQDFAARINTQDHLPHWLDPRRQSVLPL